jgi:hypothetical protein
MTALAPVVDSATSPLNPKGRPHMDVRAKPRHDQWVAITGNGYYGEGTRLTVFYGSKTSAALRIGPAQRVSEARP